MVNFCGFRCATTSPITVFINFVFNIDKKFVLKNVFSHYLVTVCAVVQNCCKGRSKKYRKWHFSGCCRRETLNRLIQNLAWVITSGTLLSIPNGISICLGAWPPRRDEMLMVCAF